MRYWSPAPSAGSGRDRRELWAARLVALSPNQALHRRALTLAAVAACLVGLWILNGACRFALGSMPPPELVAEYRAVFYQRSGLGVGCILLGIVLLRLRGRAPGEAESRTEPESDG